MKINKVSFLKFIKNKYIIVSGGSLLAIGSSFAITLGLASTQAKPSYVDYFNAKHNISYYDDDLLKGTHRETQESPWWPDDAAVPKLNDYENRKKFSAFMIDGATHSAFDHSFNQSGLCGEWNFIEQTEGADDNTYASAKHFAPTIDTTQGFIDSYNAAIQGGAENLVLCGFPHATPLTQFSQTNNANFQKSGFIFLDGNIINNDGNTNKQIANVMFRADQSAFMCGLAICQYLNENFDEYIKDGQLSVGAFGGTPIPTVTVFMGGLQLGIWTYNKMIEQHLQEFCHYFNCDQDELEKHKVKFISLGKQDSYFSGNFTQGDGRSVVQELLAKKVSAIMPVAGPQTFDCTQEIINQHSHAVVIGVDTAQENDPTVQRESHYVDKNNNQQVIKFSAQKNITNMLTDILNNVKVNGHLGKIGIGGYGDLTVGDFRNEGAHSSRNSIRYLKDFFQVFLTSYPWNEWPTTDYQQMETLISFILNAHNESLLTIVTPDNTTYSNWSLMIDANMEFRY